VSLKFVLAAAEEVLMASAIPARLRDETLSQLGRRHLSESLLQLIFQYKCVFETIRQAT
jgi:hypothetical protein